MRSVFSVRLPSRPTRTPPAAPGAVRVEADGVRESEEYPTDDEIRRCFRVFGWEPIALRPTGGPETDGTVYRRAAAALFDQMPELPVDERDAVIFFGYLSDTQTRFMVTRTVPGSITCRLLQEDLPRLKVSTERMVRRLLSTRFFDRQVGITHNRIVVYERNSENILITGRSIPGPWREAWVSGAKDRLITIVCLVLLLPVTLLLWYVPPASHVLYGSLERLSTALIAAAIVSAVSLYHAYLNIRRTQIVIWSIREDSSILHID